jgi:spermidine/putrescine transport system permease protein
MSLVFFSFNSSRSLTVFEGFSLRWYLELFQDIQVNEAVTNTFIVAIIATIISTLIGTFAAIAISRMRRVIKDALLSLNSLPIVNPEIVTAVSLLLLFLSLGVTQGYITMILAHIAFLTPYVIVTIYPKLRSMDENIVEAALDLGASPWKTIWLVIVPNIKSVIFAAASIAFTLSFDDFVISYFTAGTVKNISIFLYTLRRIEPTINALSTLMITGIVLVLFVGGTFKREKGVN